MNDIITSSSSAESGDARSRFIAGMRAFADWLEANPAVKAPRDQRLLLALHTNQAVAEFAAEHGLEVTFDAEGNASCDLTFGFITYHVYGYVDFTEHCARKAEKNARQWAKNKGLEIVAVGGAA